MKNQLLLILALIITISSFSQSSDCACCTEVHSQFDFWIGTWEVTNVDGSKAGENVITKIQDNCILQENWTSATPGYTGTSNNFYNSKTKQWEQIWLDNSGGTLHLKGSKIDNKMILRTDDETNANNQTYFHRITWTANKDGTVRQLWETITANKTVIVAFDGLYKRIGE